MRRSTREAEAVQQQHNVKDWVEEIARRKFRWAGHVAIHRAGLGAIHRDPDLPLGRVMQAGCGLRAER